MHYESDQGHTSRDKLAKSDEGHNNSLDESRKRFPKKILVLVIYLTEENPFRDYIGHRRNGGKNA